MPNKSPDPFRVEGLNSSPVTFQVRHGGMEANMGATIGFRVLGLNLERCRVKLSGFWVYVERDLGCTC